MSPGKWLLVICVNTRQEVYVINAHRSTRLDTFQRRHSNYNTVIRFFVHPQTHQSLCLLLSRWFMTISSLYFFFFFVISPLVIPPTSSPNSDDRRQSFQFRTSEDYVTEKLITRYAMLAKTTESILKWIFGRAKWRSDQSITYHS